MASRSEIVLQRFFIHFALSFCLDFWLILCFQIEKCRRLVEYAKRCLEEGANYYYAIEACNEVLDGQRSSIGPSLWHECLCTRAALLLKVQQNFALKSQLLNISNPLVK